jgi:hypothetical protein
MMVLLPKKAVGSDGSSVGAARVLLIVVEKEPTVLSLNRHCP